jgi:hypothetical protein
MNNTTGFGTTSFGGETDHRPDHDQDRMRQGGERFQLPPFLTNSAANKADTALSAPPFVRQRERRCIGHHVNVSH